MHSQRTTPLSSQSGIYGYFLLYLCIDLFFEKNMKNLFYLLLLFGLFSCNPKQEKQQTIRTDFTKKEQDILSAARRIIDSAYYGTLITLDQDNQPKARVMEPFRPNKDFTIWLATTPRSRKVQEIRNNPIATMHYFDKNRIGYVSLMGKAFIIDDDKIKSQKWKAGWDRFYKNQKDDYLLIKFIPKTLELISIPEGFVGDKKTWMPHQVKFY